MQSKQYDYRTMTTARLIAAAALLLIVATVATVPVLLERGALGIAGLVVLGLFSLTVFVAAAARAADLGVFFEWHTLRCFNAVCRARGLAVKQPVGSGSNRMVYPRVTRLVGNREGLSLRVRPLPGQGIADWERAAGAFALAFGVTGTRVQNLGNGWLSMNIGYQSIDAHQFAPAPVGAVTASGVTWRERLATVAVGTAEGGRPFSLPLINSHILVAGITGAGKGSVVWSLILRLMPAYDQGVVRFWGFDPKRMELSIGRSLFGDRYAAGHAQLVDLLERAHDEMQQRADELAGNVRRFDPSTAHPLHVLVIDELGYLSALLPDRKLRERAERALSGILVLGRAVGFVVVGALQDPRKETLGYRDLFPTRVAMRLPKPMVDLVLGHGMYEAGAQCDLIPPGEAGAGVAFVVDEAATVPLCVRMSWCSDDLIRSTAAQRALPAATRYLRAV